MISVVPPAEKPPASTHWTVLVPVIAGLVWGLNNAVVGHIGLWQKWKSGEATARELAQLRADLQRLREDHNRSLRL